MLFVAEIVSRLEDIPDCGAECFPFELIDELKEEYLEFMLLESCKQENNFRLSVQI